MGTFNRGDISEGILAAAIFARFLSKKETIKEKHVLEVINSFPKPKKGTGNFKQKEIDMLQDFQNWYSTDQAPLIYAFCFTGKDPMLIYPDKLVELYNKSIDKQWPDGVVYRNLGL